jgi:ribose/xylose/arabinose/galactoside ABC-type transport system permease subunit
MGASTGRTSWRPIVPRLGPAAQLLPLGAALVIMIAVFSLASPYFLAARNLTNLLVQVAPLALVAAASTMVIVQGEIDMSLGSVAGLSGAIGAIVLANQQLPWQLGVVAVLAVGIGICGLQGGIVVLGRVQSFAVTLAGFFIWFGVQVGVLGVDAQKPLRREPIAALASARIPGTVALSLTVALGLLLIGGRLLGRHRAVSQGQVSSRRLIGTAAGHLVALAALAGLVWYLGTGGGIPLVFVLSLVIIAIVWLVMGRTRYGRHIYAVGGNVAASRAMGIPTRRIKWVTFAVGGMLTAIAGLELISYTGGADTSTGAGSYMLQAIGAAVVGGVALSGGRGSVMGALGGALLLSGVQNGLALMSLDFYVVDIALGTVVLAALFAEGQIRRRLLHK